VIHTLGKIMARFARRFIPDPFIFAVFLTIVTWVMGVFCTESGPWQMVLFWYKGFWELLGFGMQMCLILTTGYAVAVSGPVHGLILRLARSCRTPAKAYYLVALCSVCAGLINWGLGLIVGALLAREVSYALQRESIPIHYPLLGACGYVSQMVWHGGLSGSAPLQVATPGHFLADRIGMIPVSQTIFSPLNLSLSGILVLLVPAVFVMLRPREGERIETVTAFAGSMEDIPYGRRRRRAATPAQKIEESRILSLLVGVTGIAAVAWELCRSGSSLDLNAVNFIFLFAGILLHRTPMSYVRAVGEGAKGCAGIILQFPFYAGIMGMMKYSGLVAVISSAFVAVSSRRTFPFFTFLSAGIINLFVPSGGGQWAVQGPISIEAGARLGLPAGKIVMAVAYGDEWTNMLQPFWALPLLGITGLRARDIMGYTITVMLVSGVAYALLLLLFPS